jgi:hypothetical protein
MTDIIEWDYVRFWNRLPNNFDTVLQAATDIYTLADQ